MSRIWRPSFISRVLFRGSWSLEVTAQGLQLDERFLPWASLQAVEIRHMLLWGHLQIEFGSEVVQVRGLRRSLAGSVASTIKALQTLLPAAELLQQAMQSDLYVANRTVRHVLSMAGGAASKWGLHKVPLIASDLEDLRPRLQLIHDVARNDFSTIEVRNNLFIETEKQGHDAFFNSVESSVLTEEQRVATIIMEDRNLVIAAAGSGKTSVLVAKVGYLVKKGYAKPEEILILSFNSTVAREIEQRIDERLLRAEVIQAAPCVSTFHAFGLNAIKESGPAMRLAALALSAELRSREIQKIFFELIQKDAAFKNDAIRFLVLHATSGAPEEASRFAADFGTSWRELLRQPVGSVALHDPGSHLYLTLSGDIVRSKQELQIANWLTLMGIEFVYERPFPPSKEFAWTQDYRPDFYYPGLDLWHEHFGINTFGKAPLHWAANKQGLTYEQQAESKRQALIATGARWFETTSGDFETDQWEEKLRTNLESAGAKPALIDWERFHELSTKSGFKQTEVLDLLGAAIAHFKSNHLTIEALKVKALGSSDKGRNGSFSRLFEKVFARYQDALAKRSEIDFDDMLRIAAQRLQAMAPSGQYKAILIDEFQDMSNARAELVKALLHQNPEATLFAVGDDWQSIYRFTGSDIGVMTRFEELFGHTRKATLATTFRCNQGLADLSSEFIRKNPSQIDKSVSSISDVKAAVVRVVFHAGAVEPALVQQLEEMAAWASRKGTTADVCLLGRYNFLEPVNFTALAQKFRKQLNLSFSSVHRAKGLGFDFVIVLGMTSKVGSDFPSTRQDDPVLSLFVPEPDALEYAEERRLFYVALTRAKRACVLLTPKFYASPFVTEILKSQFQESVRCMEISKDAVIDVPEPLTAAMQQVCPTCRRGRLLPRISEYGPFMVCERKDRGLTNCKNIQGHIPPGRLTRPPR